MAPMASTDDGKVDVIVFKEVNRRDIINIFINVFKGNHIHHDQVEIFNAKEIQITSDPQQLFMADGELLGETPLKLKVLPKELSILI